MWTGSSQIAINVSRLEELRETLQPISVRVSNDVLKYNVTIVVFSFGTHQMACMFTRDQSLRYHRRGTTRITRRRDYEWGW